MTLQSNSINTSDSHTVAKAIIKGQIGIFPCDTIWGLVGRMDVSVANRLARIKQRDPQMPFLVLAKDPKQAMSLYHDVSQEARLWMDKLWPGPYTLIYQKAANISDEMTGGRPTVAVRVPDYEPLNHLLSLLPFPILSTSLNISGQAAIQSIKNLPEQLSSQIGFIYTGAHPPQAATESTIIDLTTDPPTCIRQGTDPQQVIRQCA